jgi:Flp pilus assembly protein TadG
MTLRKRLFNRQGRDLWRSESGSALIEMALSLTSLMTFVFVLMELCLLFYTYGMMSESAREGTHYGSLHGSTCVTAANASCTASAATIENFVKALGYPNVGGGTLGITASFPSGNESPGSLVEVVITYTFPIKLPFVPRKANSISLTSYSEITILQ